MTEQVQSYAEPFEGRVFTELAQLLPDDAICFASSSMPVRDMDTFYPPSDRRIRFLANRGANGIDGVVSTSLGAAAAGQGRVVLVIGDIAFYHDMNGLLASKLHSLDALVILVNNDGGGIFSFLPQAAHPEHFEALFGTPHGLHFRHVAELYDAIFCDADDWSAFRSTVQAALQGRGLHIVQVRTNRETNVTMHRAIWKAVRDALAR
jgi:2-succinyl-5-enolpyruvyl-6-hydroxy-3-cyclohexene-1-carboxylate synthase